MTALTGANRAWIETLYARYLESPASVDAAWRAFFDEWRDGETIEDVRPPEPIQRSIFGGRIAGDLAGKVSHTAKNAAVIRLIEAYRRDGHLAANLDPLGIQKRRDLAQLTLAYHGLSDADLNTSFHAGNLVGAGYRTLAEIVAQCEATYCRTLGCEFMYIRNVERQQWLMRRVEEAGGRIDLDRKTALRVLEKLTAAQGFEDYIQRKYLGKKRFSVEGGESVIPLLDVLLDTAAGLGVEAAVIGMAHRGRLNILANVLGKRHGDIFEEFDDRFERPEHMGSGDVKYHLGYSSDVEFTDGHSLSVNLAFNPSHLEFVAPVVEGHVRGRQDHHGDTDRTRSLSVLIHGDAAIAGQGVAVETIQLGRLPGYDNGGSVHVVINNQIGFTTPVESARSSAHCTDVVKVVLMPVFHVNADDLGAVVFAARLAAEYRQRWGEDIILDLWCYRKFGHNEADEPTFTNPVMYEAIRKRKTPLDAFVDAMLASGVLTLEDVREASNQLRDHLDSEFQRARDPKRNRRELGGLWKGMAHALALKTKRTDYPTAVPVERLSQLLTAASSTPESLNVHRKVQRTVLDPRLRMAQGEEDLNWGAAETLAFATLLAEQRPVRVSGQDAGRGTFAHRHAVVHDQITGRSYLPLQHVAERQGPFYCYDSPLSESAVLGFEFGYSLARPDGLTIWEAQFGDFANGAQVLIDQFLCSSESKWNRTSGLVLLLPHGYEGQGPEHSSARLERFLNLSGEDNWRVVNLTTPAQIFHALRSQVLRTYRKPMVIMSPKSLLRHPMVRSPLSDLADGQFNPVLPDTTAVASEVKRVVLSSGKVYYDLVQGLMDRQERRVALVRVEQLYPLDADGLRAAVAPYGDVEVVWCQEEPQNMGAWLNLFPELLEVLGTRIRYAGRPRAAAPATGSPTIHAAEQARLVSEALDF